MSHRRARPRLARARSLRLPETGRTVLPAVPARRGESGARRTRSARPLRLRSRRPGARTASASRARGRGRSCPPRLQPRALLGSSAARRDRCARLRAESCATHRPVRARPSAQLYADTATVRGRLCEAVTETGCCAAGAAAGQGLVAFWRSRDTLLGLRLFSLLLVSPITCVPGEARGLIPSSPARHPFLEAG